MVSKLKKLGIGAVAAAGMIGCQAALAGLLTVTINGTPCADGAACDTNGTVGVPNNVVTFSPGVVGFQTVSVTAFSNNPGSPGFNILDTTWTVSSLNGTGGALTILASQTDWLNPVGNSVLQSVIGGDVLNGSVTGQEWVNLGNTLNGLGPITPGPQGPFTAPFSNSALSAPYISTVPNSITDRLTFTMAANGTSTGDLRSITPAVPEPASLLLVGAALAGLGFARRRKVS